MRLNALIAASAMALVSMFGLAQAQEAQWGDVSGAVRWGGKNLPERQVFKAAAGAFPANIVTDEWIVDPKNKGIKNVFVWLEPVEKGAKLAVHPNLQKVPDPALVSMPVCAFVPHALALRQGQDLIVQNNSLNCHNVRIAGHPARNPGGNWLMPAGDKRVINDLVADRLPIIIECNVHPWMRGYLRVFDHPYYALTDADGAFTIKNAPAGDCKIKYWHGSSGWLGGVAGKNGYDITIKPGQSKVEEKTYSEP